LDNQRIYSTASSSEKPNDLERYIYLEQLADDNQTLFYSVLSADPARFLPIVYDPTVGEACLKFGHVYRKPNGLCLSIDQRRKSIVTSAGWIEGFRGIGEHESHNRCAYPKTYFHAKIRHLGSGVPGR